MPTTRALGLPRALAELRVVPRGDQREVQREQVADQQREEKTCATYIRDQKRGIAREGRAPDQLREVRADERERHRDRVGDREAHPGEQVVDQRVAEEALEQREHAAS